MAFTKHGHQIPQSPHEVRTEADLEIARCGGPYLCRSCRDDITRWHVVKAVTEERERAEGRQETGESHKDYQERAKELVADHWNLHVTSQVSVTPEDLYVVWFTKVLDNWKCLISSDAWSDTSYFEVTYNGVKGEAYLDHYRKVSNVVCPD